MEQYGKLKDNYTYVKDLVKRLGSNIEFVDVVIKEFVKNNYNSEESFELVLIGRSIFNGYDDILYNTYNNMLDNYYEYNKYMFNMIKSKSNNNELGMGFIFISNKYKSDLIKNFFSDRFIKEIFIENMDMEKDLHNKYDNVINSREFYKYVLDIVKENDVNLYEYLISGNERLIVMLENFFDKYRNNWNNYLTNSSFKKVLVKDNS